MMRISIIIPTLNEEADIASTLSSAGNARDVEIIVVDAGSRDKTVETALAMGAKVIRRERGRAGQMNTGAAAATGEALLFLHADTRLPEDYDLHIRRTLSLPGTAASAFELRIDAPSRKLRMIERLANWRSRRLQLPYGDQAIFLKASLFRDIGGFPEIPIMEDFELMRRLRKQGRIVIVPVPILTSARRWRRVGFWKTTLINQAAIAAYCIGVAPSVIARWYYRQ